MNQLCTMKYLTLVALCLLAACSTAELTGPREMPTEVNLILVPTLPVPADLTFLGATRRPGSLPGYSVTLQWQDTAEGELNTCFRFDPVGKQGDPTTQCAYAFDYGDGVGTRIAALPVTRGVYTVTAYVTYFAEDGVHPRSRSSEPITVTVR